MKFSGKILSAYDSTLEAGTIERFFNGIDDDGDEFAVSGLADLRNYLLMTSEWMSAAQPKVDFLEHDFVAPGVFRDGDGKRPVFGRSFKIPTRILESERKYLWKDGHSSFEQPFTAWVHVLCLARNDYWPSAGDTFLWRDTWRQITATKVDPSDYFMNTGFPLYIRIESSLWIPEVGLDGVTCSPASRTISVSGIGVSRVMPISEKVIDVNGSVTIPARSQSTGSEPVLPSCGCPVKTPNCYVGECACAIRR